MNPSDASDAWVAEDPIPCPVCGRESCEDHLPPDPRRQAEQALDDLLHTVRGYLRRYVVLSDDQAVVVTLWVAHTHAIAAADCTPYLQITSATAEAGKTRLLEALEQVVSRPWLTGRTSAAALVRKVDAHGPTLLLDESDAAFNGEKDYAEALRGLLNTGYRRSGKSTLCTGQGANLTYRDFSTFCPKAIAGIGKLPDTVVSRAVRIELRRRTKTEPVAKFRERDAAEETRALRDALDAWATDDIAERLRAARPTMPAGMRDRAEDVLEPLVAIADVAGGPWPVAVRTAGVALMGGTDDQDINVQLLHDIKAMAFPRSPDDAPFLKSADLVAELVALEDRPWADWRQGKPITARAVAERLKGFGIFPLPNKRRDARGYYRDRFEDAWTRYPPSETVQASEPQ